MTSAVELSHLVSPVSAMEREEISKRDYVFVVNPTGANGRSGREWKRIYPTLCAKLGQHWNVREVLTSGPSHATEIARKALLEGAYAVVAVGGDGTLHEVMNGFFESGEAIEAQASDSGTALGVMPLGTGCDFARTFNWKSDSRQSIERLARGKQQKIDVGRVIVGADHRERYFINVADVHLSAKAGYIAGKYKCLGVFSYVIGSLQAFRGHTNRDVDIKIDGGEWQRFPKVTAIAIGNAKYFGGGMKIAPEADPSSRDFDVVILQDFHWYHFVMHLFKLYSGTFTRLKNVWHGRVRSIEIREPAPHQDGKDEGVYVQADGEFLGYLPASFTVIPASLDLLV